MNTNFYQKLSALESFNEITNPAIYTQIPDDWYLLVSDVIGSRKAIQDGKYKEVNTIGASCIVAVLNELDTTELPFVFGGDGASICVPPEFLEQSVVALIGAKNMASVAFSLDLRIGAIPVKNVTSESSALNVAKVKVSDEYHQAVFTGGGMALADKLLKADNSPYLMDSIDQKITADFTGLECRWDRVEQSGKQVISLLVKSNSADADAVRGFDKIIRQIEELVHSEHPIAEQSLKFSFNPNWLKNEIKTRNYLKSRFQQLGYICDLYYRIILGRFLMRFRVKTDDFNWGEYKSDVILNSDYKKFDDMLRVVLSCTKGETETLISYLNSLENDGEFRYGMHISDAAIITCMIKEYSGTHFHFVDGGDGGYAMAAIDMASKS